MAATQGNATSIQGISVSDTAPANGEVLQFNSTTGEYEPTVGGGGGGDVTAALNLTDDAVVLGDGGAKGVKTSTFTYDGSNLQLTGDIGSTGTRITKGWFTDLEVTNAIAGSITGNAGTVSTITGLAPDTATTQATQPNITSAASLATVGTITTGTLGAGAVLGGVTMTLGSDADGDIYYRSGGVLTRLGIGSPSQQLRVNVGGTAPEWATISSGGLTWGDSISDTTGDGITVSVNTNATGDTNLINLDTNNTSSAFDVDAITIANDNNAGAGLNTGVKIFNSSVSDLTSVNNNRFDGAAFKATQLTNGGGVLFGANIGNAGTGNIGFDSYAQSFSADGSFLFRGIMNDSQAGAGTGMQIDTGTSAFDHVALQLTGTRFSAQIDDADQAPGTTTNKLYSLAGDLQWAGAEVVTGDLTVESTSVINQDVTTDADVTFNQVTTDTVTTALDLTLGFDGDTMIFSESGATINMQGSQGVHQFQTQLLNTRTTLSVTGNGTGAARLQFTSGGGGSTRWDQTDTNSSLDFGGASMVNYIINLNRDPVNTIIRGDNDASLVYCQASTDRVGIGTNTPAELFDVDGLSRAQTFTADGDVGSGVPATNRLTGVTDTPTTDPGWATSSTVDMNAPDGYVKAYVGTQAVVIPYWNT